MFGERRWADVCGWRDDERDSHRCEMRQGIGHATALGARLRHVSVPAFLFLGDVMGAGVQA